MGCGCRGVEDFRPSGQAVSAGASRAVEQRVTDAEPGRETGGKSWVSTLGTFAGFLGPAPPAGAMVEAGVSAGGGGGSLGGVPAGGQTDTGAPASSPGPQGFPVSAAQLGRPVDRKRPVLFGISASTVERVRAAAGESGGGSSWMSKWLSAAQDAVKAQPQEQAGGWWGSAVMEGRARADFAAEVRKRAMEAGQREVVLYRWTGLGWSAERRFVGAVEFARMDDVQNLRVMPANALHGLDPSIADAIVGDILAQTCVGWGMVWGRGDPLPYHHGIMAAWEHMERRGYPMDGGCSQLPTHFRHFGSLRLGMPPGYPSMAPFWESMGLPSV